MAGPEVDEGEGAAADVAAGEDVVEAAGDGEAAGVEEALGFGEVADGVGADVGRTDATGDGICPGASAELFSCGCLERSLSVECREVQVTSSRQPRIARRISALRFTSQKVLQSPCA
jgi:hypothetical protein